MKVCIMIGSPRPNGNTATLVAHLVDALKKHDVEISIIDLYQKQIKPCIACKACQNVFGAFGCPQKDDMQDLFDSIRESDIFLLATPIYSWYCTPPMKAMLDRLVYVMNKYYGNTGKKECLWKNKRCAIITTCGYRIENGTDLFEQGMIRYCRHSNLEYMGMLAARDEGDRSIFMNEERFEQVNKFAEHIVK